MITGIWLYWVWVLLALILDYVILNCVYYRDENTHEKTDKQAEYPAWMWLVFVVYPFVPVINVVGFVFLLLMMSTAEKRQDMYLRGRFFEDVKRKDKSEEGVQ